MKPWTEGELSTLRARYPDERAADVARALGRTVSQVYQAAQRHGLKKSEAFKASELSARIRRGKRSAAMASTQFKKGQVPFNKGTHFHAGGRSVETQFKKGEMRGAAQHNYVPIGSERISKDGYLERKVTDDHPVPTRRWTAVHRIVWEAAHGPIPPGFIVVFKPGMRTKVADEITADKLELISRAENMRRNSYHNNYPKEVAQLIQLKGALNRKINRRIRDDEEQGERRA